MQGDDLKAIEGEDRSVNKVLQQAKLHHVGVAVASISQVVRGFAVSLGARWDEKVMYDPLQQARATFGWLKAASQIPERERIRIDR